MHKVISDGGCRQLNLFKIFCRGRVNGSLKMTLTKMHNMPQCAL